MTRSRALALLILAIMPSRSNFARFVATLAAGMILVAGADDVRAGTTTTKGVGPGGITQGGTACKGPACNAKAPTGPNQLPCIRSGHGGGRACQH
jgi:hypothetical protein